MDASNYIFDRVVLREYHFHKVSLKPGSSYIPSPKWLINKKPTLDLHNKEDNWCFLFARVLALNYQRISHNPQRVSNLMPFIPNYNWDNIEFPAGHKEYTIFERDNCDIALNILYVPHKTEEIRPAYISKHNNTRNVHANLLMTTDGYGNWHYLAIKSIPALLRGLKSTHNGDYYCLNYFHSCRTQATLEKHERLCYNNDHSSIIMPSEKNKYISTTSGKNSMRAPLVIYADVECLLMKINSSENTSANSYTERKALHVSCGYSIVTCYSYDKTENRQICYRGQDCMKHFTKTLGNIFIKYMNFEQKPIIPLSDDEKTQHDNEKVCFLCKKEFCIDKKE